MSIFKKISILFIISLALMSIIGFWIDNINAKRINSLVEEKYIKISNELFENIENKNLVDKLINKYDLEFEKDSLEEKDYEDIIREEIQSRGKQSHISFFGFTGTPKEKTLELFGRKNEQGQFVPFHSYTMKQSIIENFTLDVLQHYTTYKRYFKVKQVDGKEDREVPESRVKQELVEYVDSSNYTIRRKVEIILDHFTQHTSKTIGGRGRGMVVVRSRKHCVLFHEEMVKQMKERHLPYFYPCRL